jgi:two-component system CheB/CheR fusion protein
LQGEFEPLAQAQGIDLRVVRCTATLLSDPRLIELMLRNLLANAIKYTQPGGRILLGCRPHDEMIRIEVWDTGIGIASDQLDAVFDEFHQVENPARERERGFGLGLTIVRELGQLLGHEVNVESKPGKGSVFSVLVPRGSLDKAQVEAVPPPAPVVRSTGCTIALIEDDPDVCAALDMLLTAAGHAVISAKDGPSALALVREGAIMPDIVLTDYTLPGGMNGLEVLAELRKLLKWDVLI